MKKLDDTDDLVKEIDQFILEERRMPAGLLRSIQERITQDAERIAALSAAPTGDKP